jgi:hypothetical protein
MPWPVRKAGAQRHQGGRIVAITPAPYPVQLAIDYPDRPLNRLTSALRIFTVIPIAIVLSTVAGSVYTSSYSQTAHTASTATAVGAGGLLFIGPLLMILFRQKYPRWWFEWNRELLRFQARVSAYLALMSDIYPSTDEDQYVHLDFEYPDAKQDLNRWLPLVKWLLAIPHFIILFFLGIAVFFVVIVAWFVILFTGRYPQSLFRFVEGFLRWSNRVIAYAIVLVTDRYPPFTFNP